MRPRTLTLPNKKYVYYSLTDIAPSEKLQSFPCSLKILLENLYRHGYDDLESVTDKLNQKPQDISFHPSRVLMQDFTGVPAIVDLAALRDAAKKQGHDPQQINPLIPVDLVIDHSVTVDHYATDKAFERNVSREYQQNQERYRFLKWGQAAFKNFRVVPPGTGICHQVNLEYLAQVVWQQPQQDGTILLYPDTVIGTDSHTTMINGLSVLGWGVGGIEAEAAMLGQSLSMLMPEVVGVHLKGQLSTGVTATDLVLTLTQLLRQKGVVGKFVEFYGSGLDHLSLPDRATIANMAPEYGATCGFFPTDQETLTYLALTGRTQEHIAVVEAYTKAQGLWRDPDHAPIFNETLELNLEEIQASVAGPKRPQDRIPLSQVPLIARQIKDGTSLNTDLKDHDVVIAAITSCTNTSNPMAMIGAGLLARKARALGLTVKPWVKTSLAPGSKAVSDYLQQAGLMPDLEALGFYLVGYGCTTCIGNSGPLKPEVTKAIEANDLTVSSVLSGNRNFEGRIHPLVKANYLASPMLVIAYALAGTTLQDLINEPLADGIYLKDIWPSTQEIQTVINQSLSSELFKRNYENVFKGDEVWQAIPTENSVTYPWDESSTYIKRPPFLDLFDFSSSSRGAIGDAVIQENTWMATLSTVARHDERGKIDSSANSIPNGFQDLDLKMRGERPECTEEYMRTRDTEIFKNQILKGEGYIYHARILGIFGDSITTDHISPAGSIRPNSPAGEYLLERGVEVADFNSYGSRRGHDEVMARGTFANIRLQNEMVPGKTGGFTLWDNEVVTIYEASRRYKISDTPLIIIAGKEYGSGSSRDWAAKGPALLGVRAIIAESFERIHRSNLVGMGILPLEFIDGMTRHELGLNGTEMVTIEGIYRSSLRGAKRRGNPGQYIDGHAPKGDQDDREEQANSSANGIGALSVGGLLKVTLLRSDNTESVFSVKCRLDTPDELECFNQGGILCGVLNQLKK